MGGLVTLDKKTAKIQKFNSNLSRQNIPSHSISRKMPLVLVDPNCVWAGVGNEIHILSTKVKGRGGGGE